MTAVPRLRDSVLILRLGPDCFQVSAGPEGEAISLSASGYDLLTRMDGVSETEEVRRAFEDTWSTSLSEEQLKSWLSDLDDLDLFVRDSSALHALNHLHHQGLRLRGARVDRREEKRGGRRQVEAEAAGGRFQHAVFLLNEGYIHRSIEIFETIADDDPGALRTAELVQHLRNLTDDRLPPEGERRDVSWEVFDRALASFLEAAVCPSCDGPVEIELGGPNRCLDCGASFSAYLLEQCEEEQRSS
ncbi:MAG: hypothetical protein VX498_10760 [Myxococcota bacterium]|nr:hypothetical protein [Myxococcota bacterium]